ncbi:MAG: 3-hydroxyacyl-CoA dehydrogenase NAD-binding domain-containing protein, partial [bacterium]|nr:3-hydroxyacyl-CoA dehydrogenase NAD-binding domain-containing protein [bacterium]
ESRAEQLKMLCTVTGSYDDLSDVDLVIEAVPENPDLKRNIFQKLGELLPGAILTSNTSSIPITSLSLGVKDPGRVAGMHFFNPPTKMPLVELISAEGTSVDTLEALEVFAGETLAKKAVRVKDRPGFLVNVLLGAYLTPAIRSLESTDVKPEAIDECARAFGWPMGPFVLLDMMGVDVVKEVVNIFFSAYGRRFTPSRLVDVLVSAGRLGVKSGAGFYGSSPLEEILAREFPDRSEGDAERVFNRMMDSMVNEAVLALQDEVASANDIETGCLFGLGFPQAKGGPLHYADEVGAAKVAENLGVDACPLLCDIAGRGDTFFSSW